jgi:hypothetical protein
VAGSHPLLRQVFEDFLFKEDLQELCEGLGHSVDGSKEDLIGRLLGDPRFDPRLAIQRLEVPQLQDLCVQYGLDPSGKKGPLQVRLWRVLRDAK